jgi:hypothetical protein
MALESSRWMFARHPPVLLVGLLACTSPAIAATIDAKPASDHPGAKIHVIGSNFAGGETVEIRFDNVGEQQVAANAQGDSKTPLSVPEDATRACTRSRRKAGRETPRKRASRSAPIAPSVGSPHAEQASIRSRTSSTPAMSRSSRRPGPESRAATSIHPRRW